MAMERATNGARGGWLWAAIVIGAGMTARGEDPVVVDVTGPLSGKVGDKVAYEVELVNRSGRNLEKLRIIDYFDAGFHHEASVSPIEQKGTIDLAAGTSKRLTLEFLLDEPGRQCHRVEIIDQNHQLMGKATECILVLPAPGAPPVAAPSAAAATPTPAPPAALAPPPMVTPPPVVVPPPLAPPAASVVAPPLPRPTEPIAPALSLGLTGPAEATVGGVGKFVATVRNTGATPSSVTKLEIRWDDPFTPLEATEGHVLAGQTISWTLPALAPGSAHQCEVDLRPETVTGGYRGTARACVKAVVTDTAGGEMVADESCVTIRAAAPPPVAAPPVPTAIAPPPAAMTPPPARPSRRTMADAGLRVTLADLDDPVAPGGGTTVVCTVTNDGNAPTGKLNVVVSIPEQARFLGDPVPSRVRMEGRSVTFDAVGGLPPGGHAIFEVSYRLPPGSIGQAMATVTADDIVGSGEGVCSTTFLAP